MQKAALPRAEAKASCAAIQQNRGREPRFAPCCAKTCSPPEERRQHRSRLSARQKPAGSQLQCPPAYMSSPASERLKILELMTGIEPVTSPLPRECSTN